MGMTRQERIALHKKQERLQVKSGTPAVSDLSEGVPVLRSPVPEALAPIAPPAKLAAPVMRPSVNGFTTPPVKAIAPKPPIVLPIEPQRLFFLAFFLKSFSAVPTSLFNKALPYPITISFY